MSRAEYGMSRQSYVHCGSEKELVGETVGRCLDRIAERHPNDEALVCLHQAQRFTYARLRDVVNRAAKAFLKLGIERGDRVAIWSINSYEWVVAQLATAKIGAVLVNINPAYRTHELEYVLRKSRSKVLLLVESFKRSNYLQMFYDVCPEAKAAEPGEIDSWRFPYLKDVVFIGQEEHPGMYTRRAFAELGDELDDEVLFAREAELDFDDVINIQYTSGATGFPKGVMLSHHSILNSGVFVGDMLGLSSKDRVCVPVPLYHCFGMVVSILGSMTHGAAIVIPGPSFDAGATLTAVDQEKCTVLHGVPTMFIEELEHPEFDAFDLSTLRTGIMAGAPCPIDLMKRVVEEMGMKEVLIAYGQTEASLVTTITRRDDSIKRRVGTVGRVMPHQELKIIDPATGRTVPRGEQGEICFRGYQVMAGYDNNPEATSDAIDNAGWLHSGDLGVLDEAGYLKITGRIKDMVIRAGENLFPREIEEFLHTLPIVAEAQVVGVPDEKYGEELLACMKLHKDKCDHSPSDDEFRQMCSGKIAQFKVPRYWMVVEEFPVTVTGKVQKFKIREQAIREFHLEQAASVETA